MEIFLYILFIMFVGSLLGTWAERQLRPYLDELDGARRLKRGDTQYYWGLWVKAQEDERVSKVVRKVVWGFLGAFLLWLTFCIGGPYSLMGIIIIAVLLLVADHCM